MSERENILGRVREALRVKTPRPGSHGAKAAIPPPGFDPNGGPLCGMEPPIAHAREWLPHVGASLHEQLDLFARNCADLHADFQLLDGVGSLKAKLANIRDKEQWHHVASHAGELTGQACAAVGLPTLLTDGGYDAQALEKCDAAITECDALIAQTGSVLVTSRSTGGRALSILPPHHVVVAWRAQMVADLPAALALLQQRYASNFPSMISFITGPSRTGDIERILVLGAHGPKKLTILCL